MSKTNYWTSLYRIFNLPPELLEKKPKVLVEISDDSDDENDKIGFVQHLSATKKLLPFERFSQLCKLSCCLEDNARLFPKLRKYLQN